MDTLVHLRKKKGAGEQGKINAGAPFLAILLWTCFTLTMSRLEVGSSRLEVGASRRRYAGGRSCLWCSWRAWRIRDCRCVMFGEMVKGADCVGGMEKEWMGCFMDDLRAFSINADQWTTAAQGEGEWHRTTEQGAERFMAK